MAELQSLTLNGKKYDEFKPAVDTTLSVAGKAADAKAVGDALARVSGGGGASAAVDKTLSVEGMAADAKATGDALYLLSLEITTGGGSTGGGTAVEDGGYYTPSVTQPNDNTVRFAFTPSKSTMPAVESRDITLPGGGGGGGLPVPATASVGQFITVSAVDADGKVTATEAVTIPNAEGVSF